MRAAALALVVLAPLPACSHRSPELDAAPNVLLISIDTLRADHLGAYGYPLPTSPALDAFAAQATRYADCRSTAPWTLPSHASMFTGRYPFQHGAHSFKVDTKVDNVTPLADDEFTLAEALEQEGFETAAFVANKVYLAEELGIAQGFDEYVCERKLAPELVKIAGDWIEEHKDERFFLFLNFMDTHAPYNFDAEPPPGLPAPDPTRGRKLVDELCQDVMGGDAPIDPELRAKVIGQYDAAIHNVDARLGELFARIRALGLWDKTLIVVTSDHGEYFGEHRIVEHSKDLYEEAMRVPLIVKRPGQSAGELEPRPTSLVDLPHFVFACFPPGLAELYGKRFPYAPGNRPLVGETYFARLRDLFDFPWGKRFDRVRAALYEGSYKYILSSDGKNELFDLAADPGEEHDLTAQLPEVAARMRAALEGFRVRVRTDAPKGAKRVTGERRNDMKELGYY